eukprot:11749041-Karenia_brevis.AAC.1
MATKSIEYNLDLWIASIDLRKAFDQIEHPALIEALTSHEVPNSYIQLLIALYGNQTGKANSSRIFNIERGVKQGDTLSTLLFNCILEDAFTRWKSRLSDHGFLMENGRRITNARFADDI